MSSSRMMTNDLKPKKSKNVQSEYHEQVQFVSYIKKRGFLIVASANGGARNIIEAVNLKRMGLATGFPDLFIPYPTKKHHGFFCEMKKKVGGRVSIHQVFWIEQLNSLGYYAVVSKGFEEAVKAFETYLNL